MQLHAWEELRDPVNYRGRTVRFIHCPLSPPTPAQSCLLGWSAVSALQTKGSQSAGSGSRGSRVFNALNGG